jgi:hypothetical protein
MADESTDEMILADLLDVLCDFTGDADQCLNPWSDETLAPLRALAERLRRWHRPYSLGDHRPRPRSVTIGPAVSAEDTTITLADARYLLVGDVIDFGGEVMGVTAAPDLMTNTIVVVRALRGTVAAGHPVGEVGRLIGNTRTGHDVIDPPPPTVLSGPDRRRMRETTERSRRVREDLVITPPDHLPCPLCHREPVAAGGRLCAECSAHYVAYPETDGLTIRSRTPAAGANIDAAIRRLEDETTAARARAEDITPPHLSRFARSVRAVIGTLGRVPGLAEARRWIAVDLRDGALTSESAAERLRLLDELEGRAEPAREDRLRGRVCPHCGTEQPPGVGWPATVVPRCLRCGGDIGRAGE